MMIPLLLFIAAEVGPLKPTIPPEKREAIYRAALTAKTAEAEMRAAQAAAQEKARVAEAAAAALNAAVESERRRSGAGPGCAIEIDPEMHWNCPEEVPKK